MTDKELDNLVDDILKEFNQYSGVGMLQLRNFLKTHKNVNYERDLPYKVLNRMRFHCYLEESSFIEQNLVFYVYSEKGKNAVLKGGHFKYLKSIKPKMTKFELWSILIAIGAVIISGLTFYHEYNSKVENEELIKRIEILEKQIKK